MRITDNESLRAGQIGAISPTSGVAGNTQAPTESSVGAASPAAQVELSSQAQALASAKAAVDAVPDTRDDLITRLKSQIDAGTYKVSGQDVAEHMLRRAQADRLR